MTTTSENQKPVTAYCRTCGKALTEDTARVALGTVFCEEHVPVQAAASSSPAGSPYSEPKVAVPNPNVSPGLAFLLGMIPGVGAIYNGQYGKGLVHVIIFGLLVSINSSGAAGGLEVLFGMLTAVWFFYMAFEAFHTARKRQMGEPVDEYSSLVTLNVKGPGFPVAPVLLIVLGLLFLLNNLGVLRLYDFLRFWPVLLIAAGAWMLYVRLKGEPAAEVRNDQ